MTHPFTVEQRATLAFADTFRKDVWFEMPGEFVVLRGSAWGKSRPIVTIAVENLDLRITQDPLDPEWTPCHRVQFHANWAYVPAYLSLEHLWFYAPAGHGYRQLHQFNDALRTAILEGLRLPPKDHRPLTMLLTKDHK